MYAPIAVADPITLGSFFFARYGRSRVLYAVRFEALKRPDELGGLDNRFCLLVLWKQSGNISDWRTILQIVGCLWRTVWLLRWKKI
jgi:hypothetical protein